MNGFAVLVDFRLKPGLRDVFRRLVDENARTSCGAEEGCLRFDVLVPVGESDRVTLYEIYENRAAFQAHLKTDHVARFNRDSAALVADKKVLELELVCEGSTA